MDITIGDRLRAARKALGLNQTEFARDIGLSQGGYSAVESGSRAVTDRTILQACQTFRISEHWLRTGDGEMFVDNTDALVKRLQEDMGMSGSEIELLQTFLSFPADEREQVISFGKRFAARFAHDEEPDADADEAARLHAQLDAELQAEREAVSASSATSSEKRA